MTRTLPSQRRQDNHPRDDLPVWYLMTDQARLPDPSHLVARLPPTSAIIVRDTDVVRQTRMAAHLVPLCHHYGVRLLESCSRPPRHLTGDGIHIPESHLRYWKQTDIYRLKPRIVTTSAHRVSSINLAAQFGADACIFSPVFATKSHKDNRSLGLSRFAMACQRAPLPVIGLGGISEHRIRQIFKAGAEGIAGIGLFADTEQEYAK